MEREVLQPIRELRDGVYYTVHVSKDGRVRVTTGPDDQRPDHDGMKFFQPICVEEVFEGGGTWTYHYYCGKCKKIMGSLGETKEFCPRCGAGIAHYKFCMGTQKFKRDFLSFERMPDQWFIEGEVKEPCQISQPQNLKELMPSVQE